MSMSKTSLALANLRSFVILLVIGFHSVLAYLGSQPAPSPFDSPPYDWRAFPILDQERWFGFDLFCAYLYVFLMPLCSFFPGCSYGLRSFARAPGGFLSIAACGWAFRSWSGRIF